MARHWLVLLLWLALQAPGGAQAEALDAARAAYQRGDYDLALQSLRPAAEHGDAAAQFLLGILYYNGQGVERDLAASTRWYLAAARQGHAAAQFNLGNAYRFGRGVAQDLGQALRWWEAAARLGLANASHNLAVHYLQAPRTPAEQALGLAWLRHAAVRGWMDARVALRELDQPWEAGDAPPDPAREPLRSEADLLVLAPGQYTERRRAGTRAGFPASRQWQHDRIHARLFWVLGYQNQSGGNASRHRCPRNSATTRLPLVEPVCTVDSDEGVVEILVGVETHGPTTQQFAGDIE